MPKILFISHDATRTGAPILILNLVKLLLTFNEFEINFLLKAGGVLENEFKHLAPTFMLRQKRTSRLIKVKDKLLKKRDLIEDESFLNEYDFIISNTITNGSILQKIRSNYKGKIISYIHELEVASKTYTNAAGVDAVVKNSDQFWVPSSLVKEFLQRDLHISSECISIMPYYIENKKNEFLNKKTENTAFTVGGCGTVDWRKGADLFLQVANALFLKRPDASIIFKWKGATKGVELMRLEYQLKMNNLIGKVIFEESSADLDTFYESLDLFLLTSREDPYPLVILEAAQSAIPSICFDGVCGSRDFIHNSNGGFVVPFLDITRMRDAVLAFYDTPADLKVKGKNAKNFLSSTHSNKDYVYNEFKKGLL